MRNIMQMILWMNQQLQTLLMTLPNNEIPDNELIDMPLNVNAEPIMLGIRKSKSVVTTPAWH